MKEPKQLYVVQTANQINNHEPVSVAALRALLPEFEVGTFSSGAMLMAELGREPNNASIVYIENTSNEVSPLNLADAIRVSFSNVAVVIRAEGESEDFFDRAMLAGAQAVVPPNCKANDIARIASRVANARSEADYAHRATDIFANGGSSKTEGLSQKGNIVCFMGARGGAGRSTCSSLGAIALARCGHKVALVDLDMQFGDLGFIFNQSSSSGLLDLLQMQNLTSGNSSNYGKEIEPNLTLFSIKPEVNQDGHIQEGLKIALLAIAEEFDVVICNTGAFWTLSHINILDICGHIICVCDQTVIGARSSLEFLKVLERFSFPLSRSTGLINRFKFGGLTSNDFKSKFGLDTVLTIRAGKPEFSLMQESGNPGRIFLEDAGIKDDFSALAELIVTKVGLPAAGVHSLIADFEQSKTKKKWFEWV